MSLTLERFILDAKIVHKDKYDYSLVEYNGCFSTIKIICPIHGLFEQVANTHRSGNGCMKCGILKGSSVKILGTKNFIKRAQQVHNDKFDYSLVDYKNYDTKIKLICRKCNVILEQTPGNHLKYGCNNCANITRTPNNDEFIKKAIVVHKNRYDYSLVNYVNNNTNVIIICPEHGEFEQLPRTHISAKCGCPECNNKIAETKLLNKIKEAFPDKRIIYQARPEWLKHKKGQQSFDIYLPEYNIAIEYQGGQHFKPIKFFGGQKTFDKIQELDNRKRQLCLSNYCKLYYFTYNRKDIPHNYDQKVFTEEISLIKQIKTLVYL